MTAVKPLKTLLNSVLACVLAIGVCLPALPATAIADEETHAYDIDMSAWSYDSSNDVYYQIGIVYCDDAQASAYESLAIYVPGAYFDATANGDGTYTCTVNAEGAVGDYTATTAPIVMPINTSGYSAQAAQTSYSYSSASEYLEAGIIYVYAGCRGRNNGTDYDGGAPWGVTDLKAAVRCLRYNADVLPGDTDAVFSFGHSGGGAQSAVLGASGDSDLYTAYLEEIGAAFYDADGNALSDAIAGAMCWCPITSLDVADEAYEWMMGQYSTSGTRADSTWTSALSDDMAEAFADYINQAGLTDEDGTALTLEESDEGIYTSGTYYDYVLEAIETSLNNFLEDTTFPYSGSSSSDSGPGSDSSGPGNDGSGPGSLGSIGSLTTLAMTSSSGTTYETAQDYIDSLNSDEEWVTYDEDTNTATITSIEAFVTHCKSASKDVGAFDDLNLGQAENYVFGNGENDALHFDATMAELLQTRAEVYATYSDYDESYASDYADDMGNTDALGVATEVRQDMYNPMYYLLASEEGCGTSTPAKYWRIRSGIEQSDTSVTTELNLALALESNEDVEGVDFAMVWEQGHTEAERTGDADENFIEWVAECMGVESADDGTTDDDGTTGDDGTSDDGTSDDGTTDDDSTSDNDGTTGDDGTTDDDGASDDDGTSDDDAELTYPYGYFVDVQDASTYYYEAVYGAANAGYITGYGGDKTGWFGVGDSLTRAQMVAIMWRIFCPDEAAAYDDDAKAQAVNETGMDDVADASYYTAAANWAVANGVVKGKTAADGTVYFDPNGTCTFEQFCTIFARAVAGGDDALEAAFTDAEAAAVLAAFTDADDVSGFADKALAYCVENALVEGNTDKTLDPAGAVARERCVTVVWRAVEGGLI